LPSPEIRSSSRASRISASERLDQSNMGTRAQDDREEPSGDGDVPAGGGIAPLSNDNLEPEDSEGMK